jgi:hypothetical protein
MMTADTNTNGTRSDAGSPGRLELGVLVSARRTELQLPPGLPLAAWTRIGQQIVLLSSSSAWWMGDWLVYGRETFPDRYKRAMEKTSLDYQTLRNYAWVAGRFAVSRRRETLSFQHHAAVASLPAPMQDLWLDLASSRHWSTAQLRTQLRAAVRSPGGQQRHDIAALQLAISGDRHDRWEAAARMQHKNLIDWIVSVADATATLILDGP